MVIGVNFRTAPVEIRERFWISESRRYEALVDLSASTAIEEVMVLATCNRTEFIVWTRDASAAANSILKFLTAQYGLRLCEWKHFYRLLDEAALVHFFRVASSLDSMIIGEPEIVAQVKDAWALAQKVGTTRRFLDSVLQKSLSVSKRVRNETAIGQCAVSVPYAAVELAKQIFGTLDERKILLMGAGKMSELSARYLKKYGATDVRVINRTLENAQELAKQLGGTAYPFEERWQHLVEADIVISSTSCPHPIFTRDEAEVIRRERDGRQLLLIDIAVPRDIDPAVRDVHGIFLYDIDDLENVVKRNAGDRATAANAAQEIINQEAKFFRRKLMAERVVPTIVALRLRLDEICHQELEGFRSEAGPFTAEQEKALDSLTTRITQRISNQLARELKEREEKIEQDQLAAAIQKLFHLEEPQQAALTTTV